MAKKFQFRLESLLRIRTHKVEEAKEALNEIIQARLKKKREIQEREEQIQAAHAHRGGKSSRPVGELQAVWHHVESLRDQIKMLEQEYSQLGEIETLRREILSEAMKKEKVLEKLKEKKQVQHGADIAREEQLFLDDIAQRKVSQL